ncbi:hypothetical protein Fot_02156 [Forsythia ovata]|uniref:Uncharacterized protein n=1 Tax=Forsythia ovata TaxID=205694 RepID=A0ABD1X6J4_9LAMI
MALNFWTQAVGTWLIWQEVSPNYFMPFNVFHTLFKLNKKIGLKTAYGAETKLGAKRVENERANEASPEEGESSKLSLKDEEDLEVLEEVGLTRKAKKPLTASCRSL